MAEVQTKSIILPHRPGPSLAVRVVSLLGAFATRRRERLLLARLDPHLLRDIGLEPDAVRDECRKPFWRA